MFDASLAHSPLVAAVPEAGESRYLPPAQMQGTDCNPQTIETMQLSKRETVG